MKTELQTKALWFALLFVGCGTSGASSSTTNSTGGVAGNTTGTSEACIPGQSIACVGPGGCSGGQVCAANGQSYETCVCAGGSATGSSTGQSAVATSAAATSSTSASASAAGATSSTTSGTTSLGTSGTGSSGTGTSSGSGGGTISLAGLCVACNFDEDCAQGQWCIGNGQGHCAPDCSIGTCPTDGGISCEVEPDENATSQEEVCWPPSGC